jgi:hypothetical protein
MTDLQDKLERFETTAAECEMIAELTTDDTKRELYLRLAMRNRDLAIETRKAIAGKDT